MKIEAAQRLNATKVTAVAWSPQNKKDVKLLKEFAKESGGTFYAEEDHTCVELPTTALYRKAKAFLKAKGYKNTGEDTYVNGPSTFVIEDDGEQLSLSFMLVR